MLQVFYFYAPARNKRASLFAVEADSERQARAKLCSTIGYGRCPNGTKRIDHGFFEFIKM
jgi:hypothetical protein